MPLVQKRKQYLTKLMTNAINNNNEVPNLIKKKKEVPRILKVKRRIMEWLYKFATDEEVDEIAEKHNIKND